MPFVISAGILLLAVYAYLHIRSGTVVLKRAEFIRTYPFPKGLFQKLIERHPEMEQRNAALVLRGLRQFFLGYLKSKGRFVSMPSQVADDLWHEFILHTREYSTFCQKAFGGYMHHTPSAVLGPDRKTNEGLRRSWWWACKDENINPAKPARLPLLFALDAKLGVAHGFIYTPDCSVLRRNGKGGDYCAGDFSDPGVDGSTSGFGSSDNASGTWDSLAGDTASGGGDSGGEAAGGSGCGGGGCGGGGD